MKILVSVAQFESKLQSHYTTIYEYIRKDGTVQHRGKGCRLMIYVHSLIWELPSVEITCELTGSGESESIHRDEREQTGINTKNWEPRTPSRPRPVLGELLDSGVTREKHLAAHCSSF